MRDEIGVEHVAGGQVALRPSVVGPSGVVVRQHLAAVTADAHFGGHAGVGVGKRVTREDEVVASPDVGQAECPVPLGPQAQAFAQESSAGEILPVDHHAEPPQFALPCEGMGDDGSPVGEPLFGVGNVFPERHIGGDRAAVYGKFEEGFAVGCKQFAAGRLVEERGGANTAPVRLNRTGKLVIADCKPVLPGGGALCAECAEEQQDGE